VKRVCARKIGSITLTEPEWKNAKKATLKEIASRQIEMDYASYLTDSESLREIYLEVSTFELDKSFSVTVGLSLGHRFFNGFKMSPKQIEQLIREFMRFPKLKAFKTIDGQEYKMVKTIRHSTEIVEVRLRLYRMENLALKELPYCIRGIWNDLMDRFG